MDLRHLRCFEAVAEELNFRRAADRLGLSQPPVTVAIQQLETEVGAKLFVRTNRSVRLSPAGSAFRRKAAEALEKLGEAASVARQVGRGQLDRIRIGFQVPAAWGILPPALHRFRAHYPDVEIRLEPQDLKGAENDERAYDIYLGAYAAADKLFNSRLLFRGNLKALIPPGHRLAGDGPISIRQFTPETILLPSRAYLPTVRSEVTEFCQAKGGFRPKLVENLDPPSLAILALSGFGVGFFQETPKAGLFGPFHVRPFKEHSPFVQIGLAWRRDLNSPVVKCLLDEIMRATSERPEHQHAIEARVPLVPVKPRKGTRHVTNHH
jgi:DNA-binding transcriptional LysR family regulator